MRRSSDCTPLHLYARLPCAALARAPPCSQIWPEPRSSLHAQSTRMSKSRERRPQGGVQRRHAMFTHLRHVPSAMIWGGHSVVELRAASHSGTARQASVRPGRRSKSASLRMTPSNVPQLKRAAHKQTQRTWNWWSALSCEACCFRLCCLVRPGTCDPDHAETRMTKQASTRRYNLAVVRLRKFDGTLEQLG